MTINKSGIHEVSQPSARGRRDRIYLKDFIVDVEVGAFQEERGVTQRLKFAVTADLARATHSNDDVDSILSYDTLISAVNSALSIGRADLLETLAERVAGIVLATELVVETTVQIEKLDRISGSLGVEIVRSLADAVKTSSTRFAKEPRIVLMRAPSAQIMQQHKAGAQVLVAANESSDRVRLNDAWARFNVELLDRDLVAWALADALGSVSVAASRTELEWALDQGRSVVWAPSRMVLSTALTERPESPAPEDLAVWLGQLLGITRIVHAQTDKSEVNDDKAVTPTPRR